MAGDFARHCGAIRKKSPDKLAILSVDVACDGFGRCHLVLVGFVGVRRSTGVSKPEDFPPVKQNREKSFLVFPLANPGRIA